MVDDIQKKLAALWHDRRAWLFEKAFPLWAQAGVDPAGGFHDRLQANGTSACEPKRLRVQARQIVVYALAGHLGWQGPWKETVAHGLRFLREHRDGNGFYPSVYSRAGATGVSLYDQAFVLLALAHAREALREPAIEREALALLQILRARLSWPQGGLLEFENGPVRLQANPNMHFYEAALAWRAISSSPEWAQTVSGIQSVTLSVFIDPATGRLREYFDEGGNARADRATDVEPGHQFEWGSLLLIDDPRMLPTALHLIADATDTGVDRRWEVAVNALTIDGNVADSRGRLWVQTERLRATLLLSLYVQPERWLHEALKSERTVRRYLDVPTAGLWQDGLVEGQLGPPEPAKASSLYHIVNAYLALGKRSGRISNSR